MATTKGSIVGREVYDKRAGIMGKVLKEDGLSLVIEFSTADGTTTKTITPATFKRWYRLLDPEPAEESTSPVEGKKERGPVPEDQKGAVGVGSALCNLFVATVKSSANQDLEITGTKDKRMVVIKYNGRNVFEITVCKRRLVVMCHAKSLAPTNVAQVTKQYPKEFGWPLSAKFVFTDDAQLPLMRSIINDGLFYRQIVDKGEE
jgi:hypothetical protein